MYDLPDAVDIVEMLPRDGFQYHDPFIPTDNKLEMIQDIARSGVDEIEITSFAHPDTVPTLRDADEIGRRLRRRDEMTYRALVPNEEGMRRAVVANVDKVNVLGLVCPAGGENLLNMSRQENLTQFEKCVEIAHANGITVEAGLGMAFFSPYRGTVSTERTVSFVEDVVQRGVDEVTLAATAGMANPKQVRETFSILREEHPTIAFGLHPHQTNGMALANVMAAVEEGVTRFDASVCGLGGGIIFPDDIENIGNVATEEVVYMLEEVGIDTGVDFESLLQTAREISDVLGVDPSRQVNGGTKRQLRRRFRSTTPRPE